MKFFYKEIMNGIVSRINYETQTDPNYRQIAGLEVGLEVIEEDIKCCFSTLWYKNCNIFRVIFWFYKN